PYQQTNRARWNELTAIHARSRFYDVAGFKAGRCSLRPLEVEELGDVAGRSLLHLQCHFGLDTLSWARRGARVTGVDFSDHPIADVFDDSPGVAELRVAYPYFPQAEPLKLQTQGTYADRSAAVENATSYAWVHSVGEILTALLGAGLRLEFFHEHPFSVFPN